MPARLRGEQGFTLVELLVTMSILAVVMTLITGSMIFLQRAMNETDQRFDDLAQARLAMDATTKWLRSAVTVDRSDTAEDTQPFTQARRTRVDFMANVGLDSGSGAPQRVELQVVSGDLQERVWAGVINASGEWQQSGSVRTRVLARGVTDVELFTFFDVDGNDLTAAGTNNLSVADREEIRRVGIDLTVQQAPAVDVPASQLRNRVTLPNQFYFDTEGSS